MLKTVLMATSAGYATKTRARVIVGQIIAGTSAGASANQASANGALSELRRLSGLSWEQLARVMGVSRRALHFWASGKPMARTNEEHLQRVLAAVRTIDRGSAAANRTALLGSLDHELIGVDLLAAHQYDRVISLASRISASARRARTPRSPAELVGALHDTVHRDTGPARPARSVRTDRRK
jgi:transcriptional regulator with XRE-family HTH domain